MKTLLAFLASIFLSVVFASPSFAQDEVKLVRAENYITTGYHTYIGWEVKALIQVKNLAYTKQVYLHLSKTDGTWVDIPAHYVRTANSTYELWEVNRSDFGDYSMPGKYYAIKYVVNGQTYWDNNNGANYIFSNYGGYGPGPMLGNSINVLSYYNYTTIQDGKFQGYVDVRNIAYSKKVSIVYTTDNWATYATVDASFMATYQTGYSSYIVFPNVYNVERWKFEVPVTASQVKYAVSYTVNGVTYWDNNYGANYTANLYKVK